MANLLDEFRIIRPTQLSAAPSIFSMLQGKYQALVYLASQENEKKGNLLTKEEIESQVVDYEDGRLPIRSWKILPQCLEAAYNI